MQLQALMLADHAAVYDKKLAILGGIPGYAPCFEFPTKLRVVMVVLLDLTDEEFQIETPARALHFEVLDPAGQRVTGAPDTSQGPGSGEQGTVGLQPGYPGFIFNAIEVPIERPGKYTFTARYEDQRVSTVIELADMRPEPTS